LEDPIIRPLLAALALATASLAVHCGQGDVESQPPDARAPARDAAELDAALASDATLATDADLPLDAAPAPDAAARRDAGHPDAAARPDGAMLRDAAPASDSCVPETDQDFCSRLGKSCGPWSGLDDCGAPRSVASCGGCAAPQTCAGAGVSNVCGCAESAAVTALSIVPPRTATSVGVQAIFAAAPLDQTGQAVAKPCIAWTTDVGAAITAVDSFTASLSAFTTGNHTVFATADGVVASMTVNVNPAMPVPGPAPVPPSVAAPNQPLPVSGQPNARSYWPLYPGYYWIYQNSVSGQFLRISVVGTVPYFGPSAYYFAGPAYQVDFEKQDASSYWCIGAPWNLAWFLGYAADGSVISSGDYMWDFTTGLSVNDVWDYYSLQSGTPPYLLVKPNPPLDSTFSYPQAYPQRAGVSFEPLNNGPAGNDAWSPTTWSVTWSAQSVSVPAYSGPTIMAEYDEGGQQVEDWHYAQGIGVVKIVSRTQGGVTWPAPVEMNLVSYSLIPRSMPTPTLTLRDRVAFAADAIDGLSYLQWKRYYDEQSLVPAPSPAQVCLSDAQANSPRSLDSFLALVQEAGTCVPASATVTCQLLVNDSSTGAVFSVGGAAANYTLVSSVANLKAYWKGTKDGVVDVPPDTLVNYIPLGTVFTSDRPTGVFFAYPSLSPGQAANQPGYLRSVELRDSSGATVCTTNAVLLVVNP
jgi:hypothetical protein